MIDDAGRRDAERAIDKTYRAYGAAFGKNPIAAASFCNEPVLGVLPQPVIPLPKRADFEAFCAGSVAKWKALGYSHGELKSGHVKMLTAQTALYSAGFVRMKSDGAELERAAATYLFQDGADGRKIVALIVTDPDELL